MEESDIVLSRVSITAGREYESKDALLGRLRALEEISAPSGFKNRIVDIDPEDPTESELYIGESGSTPPDEGVSNQVHVFSDEQDSNEEDESSYVQTIFARFEAEYTAELQTFLNEIVGKVDTLEVNVFWANLEFDGKLDELDIPIRKVDDKEVRGVRFSIENDQYMVQRGWAEKHDITATCKQEVDTALSTENADSFVQNRIDEVKKKIADLDK